VGRVLLLGRLAARDLRRRPGESVLLLLAIFGATATLTLGLVMRGVSTDPYQATRDATQGPDVVAVGWPPTVDPALPGGSDLGNMSRLEALADAPGVVGQSGPFPVRAVTLDVDGRAASATAMGRDLAPAPVDQPEPISGGWVEDGGVVLEAAFADALGVGVGETITADGRSFRVAGVAVTAAMAPYPMQSMCLTTECEGESGLVWFTQEDFRSFEPEAPASSYVLNLALDDPASADEFVDEHLNRPPEPVGMSWQDILDQADDRYRHARRVLITGSWLLAVLAVASVAVLVGGRLADQKRRVGLLKAVGATPSLVAAVLLGEAAVVALVAAAAGLAAGWLAAPLITDTAVGLVGSVGAPAITFATVGTVAAVALGVAVVASVGPALRAARTSTVVALADVARPPRRTRWLIALSARLPVTLLLGLRIAGRRPRRIVLNTAGVFVTVSGVVAVLGARAEVSAGNLQLDPAGLDRLNQVLLVITLSLVGLAAVNAIVVAWANALEARHSSALARALGATANEVSAGLSAAQVLAALAGATLGILGGLGLLAVVDPDAEIAVPPLWQLVAVVPATAVLMVALTTLPTRLGARHTVAEVLRAEHV
jgi:putative ABC transport system permease protein